VSRSRLTTDPPVDSLAARLSRRLEGYSPPPTWAAPQPARRHGRIHLHRRIALAADVIRGQTHGDGARQCQQTAFAGGYAAMLEEVATACTEETFTMAPPPAALSSGWASLTLRNTERRLDAMDRVPFFYTVMQQRLGNLQGSIIDQRIQGTGERLCLVVDALQVFHQWRYPIG